MQHTTRRGARRGVDGAHERISEAPIGAASTVQATASISSQRLNEAALPTVDDGDSTAEMGVENMTFLVERLHQDCAPGQFVRELSKNGLQAIELLLRSGRETSGQVIWTVYRPLYDARNLTKLCCIDTGIGMTGPEMVGYVNKLAKSGHLQASTANYGVGGKISAAPLNPEGMIYMSWKDGQGSMVVLWKNPTTGKYGLKALESNGRYALWAPVPDSHKPEEIGEHGTVIVLLGKSEREDTTAPPPGMPTPKRWIMRYLNSRFFRFPGGATVHVAEGWHLPKGDKHRFNREIEGLEAWLSKQTADSGHVPLTGATAHWWILKPDADLNSGHFPTPGIVGALWQDELYDLVSARAGNSKLQSFGIIFGLNRVVLIVEPDPKYGDLTSNTARTMLLLNNEPLPWAEWAQEFRAHMPSALLALMEEYGSKAASSDHRQSIRDRLRGMTDLFRFSRYRPLRRGTLLADPSSVRTAEEAPANVVIDTDPDTNVITDPADVEIPRPRPRRRATPRAADYFTDLVATGSHGVPAAEVQVPELPDTFWVSLADGTREKDEMEDRAARYIPERHTLKINADFRVFADMEARWCEHYGHLPGANLVVQQTVREWFEQQLVEAVLSAKALEGSKHWTSADVEELWDEKALTAVVLPRYHVDTIIKRTLGQRIASLQNAKDAATRTGRAEDGESPVDRADVATVKAKV